VPSLDPHYDQQTEYQIRNKCLDDLIRAIPKVWEVLNSDASKNTLRDESFRNNFRKKILSGEETLEGKSIEFVDGFIAAYRQYGL
jgi:hypothetical protein